MSLDGPPTVLVVEDDPESRRALEWMLEIGGYAPVAVATGREALAHLTNGRATHAVILDLGLPDMPGDAFYARLRADPSLRRLPVIVFTGRDAIPTMDGVFATVLKGTAPDVLLGIVDRATGRRSKG